MKWIKKYENYKTAWFPQKWKPDNQDLVIRDYCSVNDINYDDLTPENKKNILKDIGVIRVKVEVLYPLAYMREKDYIQDVTWDVNNKRIYLHVAGSGKSASIDRCEILEYLLAFGKEEHPLKMDVLK